MKKIVLFSITMYLGITVVFAQSMKTHYSQSLKQVNVVVLYLSGNTVIQANIDNEIKISNYLMTKGDVWGWKFPEHRPAFINMVRQSRDTLFINSPAIYNPSVIGVDTYSETIENTIQLPADKKIIIRKAGDLSFESDMKYLNILNTGKLKVEVKKFSMGELNCKASKRLLINGSLASNLYTLEGKGNNTYNLQASEISINFK
ncbi:MAG: hypothetical protein HXX13_09005 [Bacteroidetes bacterium]|nr:hypothetical protein [Bacteroidota bacterium]